MAKKSIYLSVTPFPASSRFRLQPAGLCKSDWKLDPHLLLSSQGGPCPLNLGTADAFTEEILDQNQQLTASDSSKRLVIAL